MIKQNKLEQGGLMERKFRSDRFYKIIKILVNIITTISLILGIIILINKEKNDLYYLDEFEKCTSNPTYKDTKIIKDFCYVYLDEMIESEKFLKIYWGVGILLPIVFYGGGGLINYIFPKKVKGKK